MNLPDNKYQIIYADPPWKFNFRNRKGLSTDAKNNLYNTMSADDIMSLPVNTIANDNSMLFLWVMNSEIPLALDVMRAWGFNYITVAFTWVKTTKNTYHFGGGNWTRSNPEQCLLGKKGKISRLSASVRNLIISPLREHSCKPDEVRDRIVQLMGDIPRIELFARQSTPSWDSLGDDIDGMDIRESLGLLREWFSL